jgi:hypothetical protein
MAEDDLIKKVLELMRERGTNQCGLSSATGLSQPHLSKVLGKKLKIAARTNGALLAWIEGGAPSAIRPPTDEVAALALKLHDLPPGIVMQFMQIVDALSEIVRSAVRRPDA